MRQDSKQQQVKKIMDDLSASSRPDLVRQEIAACDSLEMLAEYLQTKDLLLDLDLINVATERYGSLLITSYKEHRTGELQAEIILQKEKKDNKAKENIKTSLKNLATYYMNDLGIGKIESIPLNNRSDIATTGAALTALYKAELDFYSKFNKIVGEAGRENRKALEDELNSICKNIYADRSSPFFSFIEKLTHNREGTLRSSGITDIMGDGSKVKDLFPDLAGEGYIKITNTITTDVMEHKRALAGVLDAIKEEATRLGQNAPQIQLNTLEIKKDHTLDNLAFFLTLNPQMAAILAYAHPDGIGISVKTLKTGFGGTIKDIGSTTAAVLVGTGYGLIGTALTLIPPALSAAVAYELAILALSSTSLISTMVSVPVLGLTMPVILPIAALVAVVVGVGTLRSLDEKGNGTIVPGPGNVIHDVADFAKVKKALDIDLAAGSDDFFRKEAVVWEIVGVAGRAFAKYYDKGYKSIKHDEADAAKKPVFTLTDGGADTITEKCAENFINTFTVYNSKLEETRAKGGVGTDGKNRLFVKEYDVNCIMDNLKNVGIKVNGGERGPNIA